MASTMWRRDAREFLHRWGIFGVMLAFLILALSYSVVIPLGEAADEVSHIAYVEYVLAHKRLPPPEGLVLGEAHQAPLYYVVAALATAWIPRDELRVIANPDFVLNDPQTPNLLLHPRNEGFPYRGTVLAWHSVRLISILFAMVTVGAAWQTARTFFPNDFAIPLAGTAFVAFLPSFLSLSSVVNNDNLIIMLASLVFLVVAQNTQRGLDTKRTAILGALLGLAVLAKLNAFALWAFAASSYLLIAFPTRAWSRLLRQLALCFAIALAISSPYLVYNWRTYGDPLAWGLYLQVAPLRKTPMSLTELLGLAEPVLTSFWGRFGGALQLRMPNAIYLVLGIVACSALAGYILAMWRGEAALKLRRIFLLMVSLLLLLGAVYLRFVLADLGAGQARMLLPGLVPVGIVLTVGWFVLWQSHRTLALVTWSGGFFGLALVTFFLIQSFYALPLIQATARADSKPIDFQDTIRVVNFQVEKNNVAPGGEIAVQFDWEALAVPQENYWLALQLVGADGGVANKDGVPSAGRITTDWWQPGQMFRSRHVLQIPPDVEAGAYALTLGLHPYNRWEWLRVGNADTIPLAQIVVSANP